MTVTPQITFVDTEQTLTRDVRIAPHFDQFDISAPYRSGMFRPSDVRLHYRVNRGADTPFWYLFQITIRAAKVLKNGETSTAFANIISAKYYPERAPEWAREMGAALKPSVEIERRGYGDPSNV